MGDQEQERREHLRRLQDLMAVLDTLGDNEMPPLPVLFRLSELGVKDPAGQRVPVLRRRVLAIHRLYQDRLTEERRVGLRRQGDRETPMDAPSSGAD